MSKNKKNNFKMNQSPKVQFNSKPYLRYCLLAASITLLVHVLVVILVENLKLENTIAERDSDCDTSTEFNGGIKISGESFERANMFSGSLPSKPDKGIVRDFINQKCYKYAERLGLF